MPTTSGRPNRIAYLGPQGTFSEEALLAEADLSSADLIAVSTIAEAIGSAVSGAADAAFVPIENSIEGSVTATLDELAFGDELYIQREVVWSVHLDLLALPGASLSSVRRVLSYPHATAQCRRFLKETVPSAVSEATSSTADAARIVSLGDDLHIAALAPGIAGKRYGLETLAHAIEDHPDNETRFVLVARDVVPVPTGHDRTTIVCFQGADRPGSLHTILGQFAARSLNLTRIESRPTKKALGDYCFFIEVEGHIADEVLGDCLEELHLLLSSVRFLGSYPVSGEQGSIVRAEIDEKRREAAGWLAELRSRIAGG